MTPLLSIVAAEFGYRPDRVTVVKDFALDVHPGELVLLVGGNGSGKSTIFRSIAGDPQTYLRGTVRFKGKKVKLRPREWRSLGVMWVPQEDACFEELSVLENLTSAGKWTRTTDINDAVGLFPDIEKLLHRKAMHLSGGERRMAELAVAALPAAPTVLLLDEPTAALSYDNAARFIDFVRGRLEQGTAAIVASHKDDFGDVKNRVVRLHSEA